MRNARPFLRTLGGAAAALALVTVASAQTVPPPADKPATGTTSATAISKDSPLRLRAYAIDSNNPGGTTGQLIDIVIERWSTPGEREQLHGVLREKGGGEALVSAIQKIKPRAGFVRGATSIGWDLRFAHETRLPDGARRIVVGTDRPMSFWEAANRPRSAEYEFLIAEVRLDRNGKGEGKLVPAAAVGYDEDTNTVEIENYQQLPVRLTQVTVLGGRAGAK